MEQSAIGNGIKSKKKMAEAKGSDVSKEEERGKGENGQLSRIIKNKDTGKDEIEASESRKKRKKQYDER